jgi:isocitrate dehydrogenase (NAD+)
VDVNHEVTLVPGDRPELMPLVRQLIDRAGVSITWDEPTPSSTHTSLLESVRRTKCALMGFQRGKRDEGELPPSVVLRRDLGLFAQLRPARPLKGLPCRFDDADLLVVRETTEDVYAHLEHESIPGVYESLKVTTRAACARIARYAFELAVLQGRKRVTIVHKANIMKLSDGLFLRTAREIAEGYPQIETDDVIVDALCMRVVLDPSKFDVLLCGNLFGDIVGDLVAGLVGGRSNAPAINIGDDGTVLCTAGHGSPDTAGHADLLTVLLPALHMLHHLDEPAAADRLRTAVETVLASGLQPRDGTPEAFAEAVAAQL